MCRDSSAPPERGRNQKEVDFMSKLESIIKGLGSKQMGRITVLDSGYVEDGSEDGVEFMAALQGETRGLREEEGVRGVGVEIRGKDVIVDIGYTGSGTAHLA